jgi:Ca2+-binding RTX toxin-like protein
MSTITNKSSVNLNVEALEERANPSSYVSGNTLYIVGTNGNDTVTVGYQSGSSSGAWYSLPKFTVTENGVTTSHTNSYYNPINRIAFYGYGGNDYFNDYSNVVPITAYGMDGNDTLIGYNHSDYLDGGNGNDVLYGYDGHDTLVGGQGYDIMYGMNGNDTMEGGQDGYYDYMAGGAGQDMFQRELRWFWNGSYWYQYNIDAAQDYDTSTYGDMYTYFEG